MTKTRKTAAGLILSLSTLFASAALADERIGDWFISCDSQDGCLALQSDGYETHRPGAPQIQPSFHASGTGEALTFHANFFWGPGSLQNGQEIPLTIDGVARGSLKVQVCGGGEKYQACAAKMIINGALAETFSSAKEISLLFEKGENEKFYKYISTKGLRDAIAKARKLSKHSSP